MKGKKYVEPTDGRWFLSFDGDVYWKVGPDDGLVVLKADQVVSRPKGNLSGVVAIID